MIEDPLESIAGHRNVVSRIEFLSDRRLRSESWDGTVREWDVESGAQVARKSLERERFDRVDSDALAIARTLETDVLDRHTAVAVSADGRWLAVRAKAMNGTLSHIRVRAVDGGVVRATLTFPRDPVDEVRSLEFSRDATLLAAGLRPCKVVVWSVERGEVLWQSPPRGGRGWIRCLAFSPDGELLAHGSDDGAIQIHRARIGAHVRMLGAPVPALRTVACALSGSWIAAGDEAGRLHLWDDVGALRVSVGAHSASLRDFATVPAQPHALWSCGNDGVVRRRDARTGLCDEERSVGDVLAVDSLAVAADGASVACNAQDRDGGGRVLVLAPGAPPRQIAGFKQMWMAGKVRFSSDGALLFTSCDGVLHVFDGRSFERLRTLKIDDRFAAVSPTDARVGALTGGHGEKLWICDIQNGRRMADVPIPEDGVDGVTFSPDGMLLAHGLHYANGRPTVFVYRTLDGQVVHELGGHVAPAPATCFAREGRTLLSAGRDGTVREWDVASGVLLRTLVAPAGTE